MNDKREAYFNKYCRICKYFNILEADIKPEDPCWPCLKTGYNIDSHKPVYFEEAGDAGKELEKVAARTQVDRRVLRERDASD